MGAACHGRRREVSAASWRCAPDMQLSVLDLVPVRSDQTTGDALTATRSPRAGRREHGYHRYWLAEHHNMPAVAATNPPLLISMVAAATVPDPGRLGRRDAAQPRAAGGRRAVRAAGGGVPRTASTSASAAPPGSDPVTRWALRHGGGGVEDDAVSRFPGVRRQRDLDDEPRRCRPPGRRPACTRSTATPRRDLGAAACGCSGSSDYSARLAASRGLPYVVRPPLLRHRAPPRRSSSTGPSVPAQRDEPARRARS